MDIVKDMCNCTIIIVLQYSHFICQNTALVRARIESKKNKILVNCGALLYNIMCLAYMPRQMLLTVDEISVLDT